MRRDAVRAAVLGRVIPSGMYPLSRLYEEVAEECGVEWRDVKRVTAQLRREGLVASRRTGKHYWVTRPEEDRTSTDSTRPLAKPATGGPSEFVPGTDLAGIGDEVERRRALDALEKHRTGKAGALTLVGCRWVERAWDEPDWKGARAWLVGRTDVSRRQALVGLWREFGVPTEWVLEELDALGFTKYWRGQEFIGWALTPERAEGMDLLRRATKKFAEDGYNCSQVRTLVEKVWD